MVLAVGSCADAVRLWGDGIYGCHLLDGGVDDTRLDMA